MLSIYLNIYNKCQINNIYPCSRYKIYAKYYKYYILILLLILIIIPNLVFASESNTSFNLNISNNETGITHSGFTGRVIQMLGLITLISVAPSLIMMVTSFTRISVVFSLLRSAIGLQQTPPNAVVTGLALFLTLFIMQPYITKSYDEGIRPLIEQKIKEEEAWDKIVYPFQQFMIKNTPKKELKLFIDIAKLNLHKIDKAPLYCLIPAFMISELKKAFQIGFLLFLPFLVIDILVASVLMAMGMMMLPPAMISLPIKVIFFVMIDGWYLLCGSLIKGYGL
ncbi:flagellar type III secretion system pore protein FliP [Lyticum sinuosum]|uniref:Flagellar biosynthetic protein FliP n=1 Tax=Lyticum sinuosum TaxID=1332059 RepID=A0AAE4VKX3_9RICK|nr:flagellar type III secretion system pore protein FliP [Lyticum sinuosum]MDZ5761495.1 Flagellar biosynthetic protein FliP [Lyticum sinuosum]